MGSDDIIQLVFLGVCAICALIYDLIRLKKFKGRLKRKNAGYLDISQEDGKLLKNATSLIKQMAINVDESIERIKCGGDTFCMLQFDGRRERADITYYGSCKIDGDGIYNVKNFGFDCKGIVPGIFLTRIDAPPFMTRIAGYPIICLESLSKERMN